MRDKRVNFGPDGSGGEVTASLLFNHLKLPVEQTSFGHGQALEKLKAGEIAGMVHVAPKPVPLFQDVEVRDGLRFLPLPGLGGSDVYRPADLTVEDYPTLVFGEQTVKTQAVPLILAAYDWPTDHERYAPIAGFIDGFLQDLNDLQSPSRHEKWQDIDPAFAFEGWRRHPAVDDYLQQLRTAEQSSGRGGPLHEADQEDETEIKPSASKAIPSEPTGDSPRRPVF